MTTVNSNPLRLGLIGCGGIAYWAHLRTLQRMPGVVLIHAADPDPAARTKAAQLTQAAIASDPAAMLRDPAVDAVIIAAPTQLHAALAIEAVNCGKSVYLEKPLASSAVDAAAALEVFRRSNVHVVVGFNRRFHPVHTRARQLLAEGVIGRIHAVQSIFCEALQSGQLAPWKRARSTGGGVLLDLGSHHFDLLRWLFDTEIESVQAQTSSNRSEQDGAEVHLQLRCGVVAQCHFSFLTGPSDSLEFHGELGSLRVDRHRPAPEVRLRRSGGYGLRDVHPGRSLADLGRRFSHALRPGHDPSYRAALTGFANVLRGRVSPGATARDGAASLAVVLASETSAASGQRVMISAIEPPCVSF